MTKEDFVEILDEIGERLSGPAQHLFELAVQRTISGGALMAVIGGLIGLVLVALARHLFKRSAQLTTLYKEKAICRRDYWRDPGEAFFIGAIVAGVGAFAGVLLGLRGMFIVINAEWFALSLIVETIR